MPLSRMGMPCLPIMIEACRAEDIVQLLNMLFFFNKNNDGTDSLFHWTFLWVRLIFMGLC